MIFFVEVSDDWNPPHTGHLLENIKLTESKEMVQTFPKLKQRPHTTSSYF